MKKFGVFFMTLAMSVGLLAGCGAKPVEEKETTQAETTATKENEEKASYEKPEKLRVATSNGYFPWSFVENDELQGFAIDVWNDIGNRLGIEMEYSQFGTSEGAYGAMDSGRVDLTASHVAITPAIADKYNFTDVFGYNVIKMCVCADKDYESIEDLHGKKVCIEPGGKLAEFFNAYNENLPDEEKLELVFTEGSIWEELELGRFESFPITVLSFNARKMKGEDRNIKLIGDPVITEDNVFPVQKDMDPELLNDINKTLKSMGEDGFLSETSLKWYGIDLTDKSNL